MPQSRAGTEIYSYNLAKSLSDKNDIFVVYRFKDYKLKEYEILKTEFEGLNLYGINNTFKHCDCFEKTYKNEEIDKVFADILDEVRPDIVHIQHLLFLSVSIVEEIKKRSIPIVFTAHDYYLVCLRAQLLNSKFEICDDITGNSCGNCIVSHISIRKNTLRMYQLLYDKLPAFIVAFLKGFYLKMAGLFFSKDKAKEKIIKRVNYFKEIVKKVDIFVATTDDIREKLIEFSVPGEKIVSLPNAVDKEIFKNAKRKKTSQDINFAFLGTLLPCKGVDILIDAFNRIKEKNAFLFIYGKETAYKGFEDYLYEIKKKGRNKNIVFKGQYDHKNLADILSDIDVVVVPSIWHETGPLVAQEAILSKTPVIASGLGRMKELLRDGKNGLLVKPKDSDALYGAMKKIIDNHNILEKIDIDSTLVENIDDNAQKLEKVYLNLIKWENGK